MNCIIYDSARTETLESTAMTSRAQTEKNRDHPQSRLWVRARIEREKSDRKMCRAVSHTDLYVRWTPPQHCRSFTSFSSHITHQPYHAYWMAKLNQNIVFWWEEHFFFLSFEIIDGVCPKFRILSNMFCDGVAHLSFVDSVFGFLLSWICVVNWMGRPDKIHTKFVLNFGFGGDKRKKKNQKKNGIRFLCLVNRNRLGANWINARTKGIQNKCDRISSYI